ncbi:rifin [Plasmodium falciparum IGH-CR14]|uniref:Rifin n=1 Tax=Plasmodium falciparum IGH-CR14 TaxID=580059 RepID=A0A0L1I846_PLAFA|nr:rifin [Plasmodium falciparum IGH-CR14]
MKFNYINISLFSLSLNILLLSSKVYNQRNHILTLHKPITTSRLLCECELYAPSNYDNNPEMKAVMQDFDCQTSQRFEEYNERMIKNKQKCKEQCDKDIQKIILKDKIEKELTEKFVTLSTSITTKDIPTCVCEKSLSDKMEKTCLRCGGILGGIAPSWGLVSGIVYTGWKTAELVAAAEAAMAEGLAEGIKAGQVAGLAKFIDGFKDVFIMDSLNGTQLKSLFTLQNYTNFPNLTRLINEELNKACSVWLTGSNPICEVRTKLGLVAQAGQKWVEPESIIKLHVDKIVAESQGAAAGVTKTVTEEATTTLTAQKTGVVQTTYMGYETPIIASIVALLLIVLVMIIIYLFLRYRRKKKMKKKHQYIKLLKE